MRYLLFLLFTTPSYANSLDVRLKELNKVFNPVVTGTTGYEFEYRLDFTGKTSTWINVTKVELTCASKRTAHLEGGSVVFKTLSLCFTRPLAELNDSLIQISCEKLRNKACIEALARKTTVQVMNTLIRLHITEVRAD